jgi:cobalt-precorrin 5A hydrolase
MAKQIAKRNCKMSIVSFTNRGAELALRLASLFNYCDCAVYRIGTERAVQAHEVPLADVTITPAEDVPAVVPATAPVEDVPAVVPATAPEAAATNTGLQYSDESVYEWTRKRFVDSGGIVFVGALGIAVRAIAPHLSHKSSDPAVICVDEMGKYSISVLSGHIGGGNELTEMIAGAIGAQSVLTTATDLRGVFAVDVWANKMGLYIENYEMVKEVSSALLNGDAVGMFIDGKWSGEIPNGLIAADTDGNESIDIYDRNEGYREEVRNDSLRTGICVSCRLIKPFERALLLRPKVIVVGIGCKKGTQEPEIRSAIKDFLARNGYSFYSLAALASIDLKRYEAGIIEFCNKESIDFYTHTAAELNEINREPFSCSDFVKKTTDVDCVCERAAAAHGELIVKKTLYNRITLALAVKELSLSFCDFRRKELS